MVANKFLFLSLPVQFQSQEDELENIDSTKELELKRTIVTKAPDRNSDWQNADEYQRNKNLNMYD